MAFLASLREIFILIGGQPPVAPFRFPATDLSPPAVPPTFLTATDIDALVRGGQRVLILKAAVRLTPLARDRARELGVELRSDEAGGPRTPPGYTYPPAAQAHGAFLAQLREFRRLVAPAPALARLVDDMIAAAEGGPSVRIPPRLQLAMHGFSPTKRQQLLDPLQILILWSPRLFGPRAPHRRYDILWALTELRRCLSTTS